MVNIKIKSVALNKEVSKAKAKEGKNAYFDIVYAEDGNKVEKTGKVAYLENDKSYTMILPFGLVKIEKQGKDFVGSVKKLNGEKKEKAEKKVDKKQKESKNPEKKDKKKDDKKKVENKKSEKKVENVSKSIFG